MARGKGLGGFTGARRKAGPGRPKGAMNIYKRTIREIARGALESKEYQAALNARLIAGTSPQLETLYHYYAYGRPNADVNVKFDLSKLTDEEITTLAGITPKISHS